MADDLLSFRAKCMTIQPASRDMLIAPPQLALVTARVPGFDTLTPADRLRAAALALKREFNVESTALKLAAQRITHRDDDRILIAYTTHATNGAATLDARWFDAAQTETIYWVDAPNGFVLSNAGAAPIEHWSASEGVPTPIMAVVAQRNRDQLSATRVVIEDDRTIDEATLNLWRASLGVEIERGSLPGTARAIVLTAPPTAAIEPAKTSLDRALFAATCVAAVCALLSIARYVALPSAAPTANASNAPSTSPGELWFRATNAAPQLAERTKQASYGGGAWVITAPTLERNALPSIAQSLSANGLATQIVAEPEPRVRVQKP
jgi:hypothetical protein